MKTFLGLGECMVELASAGENLWKQGFAGDVLNTLWYARAELTPDWVVQFHSAVGVDSISDDMLAFISAANIECQTMPRIADRAPGLYSIHLNEAERSFTYWRETSAAKLMMADRDLFWRNVAAADLVYVTGITLAILPDQDCDDLIDGVRAHMKPDATLCFDPNIRPRLWQDPVRMKACITAMAAASDLVLPSFDDEKTIFNDKTPAETAARYGGQGQLVIVKDGAAPTLVSQNGQSQSIPVPPVADVVDTTAAGDSFNGAFLAEWLQSKDPARAVAAAQQCSGKVVGTKGALITVNAA